MPTAHKSAKPHTRGFQRRMLFSLLLTLLLVFSVPLRAVAAPEIAAPSAVLMEAATGTILYEKNAHERLRPASVTKIMTLLLVMEALEDGRIALTDTVTTSAAAAAKGGSQIYLAENEQLSLEEMLKAVVVSSANDCATALAEHIAGSEAAFVDLMNARAAELGMQDTHFVNCTGLDDEPEASEHLTTAWDIAIMSRELLRHDAIKNYTTIWMDTVRNGEFGLSNTNKLVRFYTGTTGLKTGYTSAAGYCLSASAERDGMELIAVVLNCQSSTDRFEAAKSLLNHGFACYALYTPQAQLDAVSVLLGTRDSVTPVLASDAPILLDKSLLSGIETEILLEESVKAPVAAGQRLGTMRVHSGGQTLAEIELLASDAVEALSVWDLFVRLLGCVCMSG